MAEPLRNIIDPGWAQALEPVAGQIASMGEFLRAEVAAGRRYLPSGDNALRAFKQPFADVRVLIAGQDPYPTPGHPVGLSFSVAPEVKGCRRAWSTSSVNTATTWVTPRLPLGTSPRGPNGAYCCSTGC